MGDDGDVTGAERDEWLDPVTRGLLAEVAVATLTAQLQRRGIRSTFLSGLRPTRPDLRLVGHAQTLRYGPMREDLQPLLNGRQSAQRRAVEGIRPHGVLVIEARGVPDAATIGDIYAKRVQVNGGAGVVTDGALRDTPSITALDLPVYHLSSHAAMLSRQHLPLETDVPVGCAGVLVLPGDTLVGDAEGVVVIPAALVVEVAAAAHRQELEEEYALERVAAGEPTGQVFPLPEQRREDFERWLAARGGS